MKGSAGVAGVIAAAFLLLHVPFLPASLEDIDSINFALGVRHFDVAQHQPHPPGYPLLIAAAKVVHVVVPSEAHALSMLSIVSGTLSVLALGALFRRIDRDPRSGQWAMLATILSATAPLYWFNASRPLSDMPGLAASIAVQAFTLGATTRTRLAAAAFLAGLAAGIRSQVIWLTVPLLLVMAARRPRLSRTADALAALGTLITGGLVWFVPLVWLSGGPITYWRALSTQGTEDLTGVGMLWTTHTPRQVVLAFNSTFVAPWGTPVLSGTVLVLALLGILRLMKGSRSTLGLLTAAFAPYLAFDLLFQESITTRYALPVIVPLAYLGVRGAAVFPPRMAAGIVGVLATAALLVGVTSVQAYAGQEAPAFRLLKDMRAASPITGAAPVLATHRREELDLRRPITWTGERMPTFSQRLPATPKHEWLELVKYWNDGGRAPVWFVADPLRSDLALVDHEPPAAYRWPLRFPILLGGVRPSEMDWYVFDEPAWYLGEGWALTPETAGIADTGSRGRGRAPAEGWIRRPSGPLTMVIGGRNFSGDGTPASLSISLDGRGIGQYTVVPGFFLRLMTVAPGMLAGAGDYGALAIETHGDVAIEQFAAQPPERAVFGYAEGWHEREYDARTGKLWRWMSEHGELRVRRYGAAAVVDPYGRDRDIFETLSRHRPRWRPHSGASGSGADFFRAHRDSRGRYWRFGAGHYDRDRPGLHTSRRQIWRC